MSDVIGFIASLGTRPPMSASDYAAEVGRLSVDAATRDALLARDARALGAALGGRDAMWCAIRSPEDAPLDEPRREPSREDEPSREEPQPDADGT